MSSLPHRRSKGSSCIPSVVWALINLGVSAWEAKGWENVPLGLQSSQLFVMLSAWLVPCGSHHFTSIP